MQDLALMLVYITYFNCPGLELQHSYIMLKLE